jgi:general secretion pathway protein J
MHRNTQARGFTLLEVLVTLAVLGILFLALAQETRVILFAADKQARLVESHSDFDAADRTLRHLIEQAAPGSVWEPLAFVGSAHSVAFTGLLPSPAEGFSPRRADIALNVDAEHRLVVLWTPHIHAVRIHAPPLAARIPVLGGIERLELAYWPGRGGMGWTSTWRDPTPPRLVRIRIIFSDRKHPAWPDIEAAPLLDPP